MKKRLTALLLAVIMLASIASCSKKSSGVDRRAEEAVTEAEVDSTSVVWSDTSNVTLSMYSYFFNVYYKSFADRYGDYLDAMGLDTSKSLKDQKFSEDRTWYEYLMMLCFDDVKQTMALCDSAKAEGKELTDDDLEEINSILKEYDSTAEKSKMTTDAYLVTLFGEKVNRATVEKCLRMQHLSAMQYKVIANEEPMTDADCQKYFDENKNKFLYFDCLRIIVPEADSAALSACSNDAEFIEAMRGIITKNNFNGNYEKYADSIEGLLERKKLTRIGYDENDDVCTWAFSDDRQPYDVYTKPTRESDMAVYMILPTSEEGKYTDILYRDLEPVRNVRYALIDDAEEAQRVYDEWKNSDSNNEQGFAALSEKYNGGTATNVDRGDYSTVLNEWMFSDNVKAGDSTVLTVDGAGTYLLYMLENGEASWLVDARSSISSGNVSSAVDELLKEFPSEYSAAIYNTEEFKIS